MVRRGREPNRGTWSEPAGKCEPGETPAQACVRETYEETGLRVRVVREAGTVEVAVPDGTRYAITDFVCEVVGGTLHAGDDAAEVRWVDRACFDRLPLVPDLADTLAGWDALPR